MKRYAQIVGWGKYVPSKVLTNDELAATVDTSDEWIRTRTGIAERRIAAPKEATASMAVQAAREALAVADVDPARLNLIIVATATPDYLFPSTACLVQDALGAERAAAFDLAAGCSGFVYALAVGSQLIAAGAYELVLVIGSETPSRVVDWTDRATCVLFGDGAGAVLLQASEQPGGVLSYVLGADGSGADLLIMPAGGSRQPASAETVAQRLHYARMDGREIYRFATRTMSKAAEQAVQQAGLALEQVDLVVPHQANNRIIETVAKLLNLPDEKVFVNIDRYGNTSAASIPIAICEAVEAGRIKPDDHLVLVSFGAGLTWAAAVVQWGAKVKVAPPPWWKRAWYRLRDLLVALRSLWRRYLRWVDALHGEGGE